MVVNKQDRQSNALDKTSAETFAETRKSFFS